MVFVYLGALLLIFSLFYPAQGITNMQLILFSSGILFIGLGEWECHKNVFGIKLPNIYTGPTAKIKGKIRKHDKISLSLELIGIILIFLAVIDLIL